MSGIEKFLSSKATLYVAIGIGVYLVLQNVGLLKDKEERKDDKVKDEIGNDQNIWNTAYWKQFPAKKYTDSQADNLSDHIWNAFGFFNDDEAKIFGVFRTVKYRANVSQIADSFAKRYSRDLLSELQSRLSDSELTELYKIVSQKPI